MGTSLRKKFRRLMRYVRTGRQEVYLAPFQTQASQCLAGKKVLVTGGGSGIGLAIARKCVACGAQVVVTGRSREKLQRACAGYGTDEMAPVVWDVCELDAIGANLDVALSAAGGRFDVLVNNAGIAERESFGSLSRETWDKVMCTNLTAPVFITQEISSRWRAAGQHGTILQISSFAGGLPVEDAYSASKCALDAFVCGMAKALSPHGIRVNGLAPGVIVGTEIGRPQSRIGVDGNLDAAWVPAGRLGTPDEIAEVAVFLVSDAAAYIHGQVVKCDGGGTLAFA